MSNAEFVDPTEVADVAPHDLVMVYLNGVTKPYLRTCYGGMWQKMHPRHQGGERAYRTGPIWVVSEVELHL